VIRAIEDWLFQFELKVLLLFVRQELPIHDDFHSIAFGIFFLLNIQREIDRTHNAITKLFMDDFLRLNCDFINGL
jgi:hypothetical protein